LLEDVRAQSLPEVEVLLVVGVTPQGRAINLGAAQARGAILIILDDDSRLPQRDTLERLVAVLRADPRVGMAGASIVQPADAGRFQRAVARELPRFNMPVVERVTDSDMPCHGCCAFRKEVFAAVGGERESIVRGLDPDLRQRLRASGYRVVLAPGAWATHPVPANWGAFVRMFYRNGRGSAYAQRHQPELLYDTDEDAEWKGKPLRAGFARRLLRFPLRTLRYLLQGRLLRVVGDACYVAGYVREWATSSGTRQTVRP
jgi:GT2 family glycosyltransferase